MLVDMPRVLQTREWKTIRAYLDLNQLAHKVLLDVLVLSRQRFLELEGLSSKRGHLSEKSCMLGKSQGATSAVCPKKDEVEGCCR